MITSINEWKKLNENETVFSNNIQLNFNVDKRDLESFISALKKKGYTFVGPSKVNEFLNHLFSEMFESDYLELAIQKQDQDWFDFLIDENIISKNTDLQI